MSTTEAPTDESINLSGCLPSACANWSRANTCRSLSVSGSTSASKKVRCNITRQRSYDLKTIRRYQQRQYAWYYRSQWIATVVTIVAALFALISAVLSWLPVQWLIVVVAFCSAFAQLIQAIVQVRLNPPQREPADELLHSMTQKQKSEE